MAKHRLASEGRWEPLRTSVADLMRSFNDAQDGLRLPIEYLVAIGHKAVVPRDWRT